MLKRIGVENLRLGMHIHEFCGSWMDHPFWRESFLLKSPADLQRIAQCSITEVWIDVSKGLDVEIGTSQEDVEETVKQVLQQVASIPEVSDKIPLTEEVQRAAKVCRRARNAVFSMFREARMGSAINGDSTRLVVDEISASIVRNPRALISLARLKAADDYTYMHSVAVCALMVSLAKQLGLDAATTREAGLAGLVHDLGKVRTPGRILNKPGKLTDEEFAIIKQHPAAGHRLLLEGNAVGQIALDVCLHHHEKMDGNGYPDRLKGEQISLFARMGAVCDVYDAITSDRPYKAGWHPAEAVRKMAEWSKGHFDWQVFQAFVKSIGIYPVGSLIQVSSGRLGVVTDQNPQSLLVPKVKLIFSTETGRFIQPETIDLSSPSCDEKIVSHEEPAKWGIDNIDAFWARS